MIGTLKIGTFWALISKLILSSNSSLAMAGPFSAPSAASSSSGAQFTYSNGSYFPLPFHLQQSAPAAPAPQYPTPYVAAPAPPAVPLPVASVYPTPAPAPAAYNLPQYQQVSKICMRLEFVLRDWGFVVLWIGFAGKCYSDGQGFV